jgi:hypothetical protein
MRYLTNRTKRPSNVDTRSTRVAHVYKVNLPTPEYLLDAGYCGGCLSENPHENADPANHTCGYGAPADGFLIAIRPKSGDRVNDQHDLADLPY